MKILITGANGQLGHELKKVFVKDAVFAGDKDNFDITKAKTVLEKTKKFWPDVIVHAAAYTAVDEAEKHKKLAFLVNETGSENVARAAKEIDARLITISTDYIFDGRKRYPYTEADRPNPLNIYGKSKLAGEKATMKFGPIDTFILRSSWIYGEHGQNFVKTIFKLLHSGKEIKGVDDQIGSPTWAYDLAQAIKVFATKKKIQPGIYHISSIGTTSWYCFACFIRDTAELETKIIPCKTRDFPCLAKRPKYSYLSKAKLHRNGIFKMLHWQNSFRKFYQTIETAKELF